MRIFLKKKITHSWFQRGIIAIGLEWAGSCYWLESRAGNWRGYLKLWWGITTSFTSQWKFFCNTTKCETLFTPIASNQGKIIIIRLFTCSSSLTSNWWVVPCTDAQSMAGAEKKCNQISCKPSRREVTCTASPTFFI